MEGGETLLAGGAALLYEDAQVLVCRKPPGIAVQSADVRTRDLTDILRLYQAEQGRQLYVVHRLDQPVQGIVVFARTRRAAASLGGQFAGGKTGEGMRKQYLAVVCGQPHDGREEGILRHFLRKDARTNTSLVVPEGTDGAKEAVLAYRVVQTREPYRLLEITLLTGRHHQIRVQLAAAGMPLEGDQKYNPSAKKEILALCACRLTFRHPVTAEPLTFTCEPQGGAFDRFRERPEEIRTRRG